MISWIQASEMGFSVGHLGKGTHRDMVRTLVGMSYWEETPRKTQDALQGLCLSSGLGMPWGPPQDELEEVTRARKVWTVSGETIGTAT